MNRTLHIALLALFSSLTASSGFASGFITAIDWSANRTTFSDLLKEAQEQAKGRVSGIALGESHLEGLTTNAVHAKIIDAYLSGIPSPLRTCIESNTGILESSAWSEVKARSESVRIEGGNGPSRTDFASCETRKSSHYLVYSGFFHQYPFARPFHEVFRPSPVITDEANNIHAQMKGVDLLFVAQMEIPYLAVQETQRLLKLLARDEDRFLEELRRTREAFMNTRKALEPIVTDALDERTKSGVLLNRNSFPSAGAAFPHEKAYLLLTDLGHRSDRAPLFLLEAIMDLDENSRKAFAHDIRAGKHFMTSGLIAPTSTDRTPSFHISGINEVFGGETSFVMLYGGKVGKILVMDPEVMQLRCFLTEAGETRENTCSEILKREF